MQPMSNKEDQRDALGPEDAWSAEFVRRSTRQRQRASLVGQAKRESLKQLEARLNERLQILSEELAREQAASEARTAEQARRAESLAEQTVELALLKEELHEEARRGAERKNELAGNAAASRDPQQDAEANAELAEVRAQCKRLQERLVEAECRLEQAPSGEAVVSQQADDLRRRFEMAVQDVRELKNQNADLKRELEAARRSGGTAASATHLVSGSDWESQKKRLMQQLDEDFSGGDAQQAADKLTVEGAIRITDQMVAEKEREIGELKRLLDDQSSNIGGLAVGATAIAAVLDQDELIREERENLKRIQDEWRMKLRQAEVDISLERAKLARERAELDEKLQRLASSAKDHADAGPDKKKSRRWLSLLVKDSEGK